jgi:gag-polypeptide of LTR copia-type
LKDQWDLIKNEYTYKGAFAQADLSSHFMESKCPEKGNVHDFLDGLCVKKEELATYGVVIEAKDYHSKIITSLPNHLSNFASNLLAGARLYSTLKTIDPNELIVEIQGPAAATAKQLQHNWTLISFNPTASNCK